MMSSVVADWEVHRGFGEKPDMQFKALIPASDFGGAYDSFDSLLFWCLAAPPCSDQVATANFSLYISQRWQRYKNHFTNFTAFVPPPMDDIQIDFMMGEILQPNRFGSEFRMFSLVKDSPRSSSGHVSWQQMGNSRRPAAQHVQENTGGHEWWSAMHHTLGRLAFWSLSSISAQYN